VADLFVVQELRSYLIAQGVVQAASDAPSLTVPSIHVDPSDGAPVPRRSAAGALSEIGTVTILDTQLQPAAALEAWIEEAFVDVIVRMSSKAGGGARCRLTHRVIRGLLHPNDAHGGRKQWYMNGLLVEYSTIWRGEQPLPFPTDGDTDVVSRVASYRFGCRRKALQGLPTAP
jgi:hypothetical protein